MALVPHKITALAESDAQGTDGKNIVAGAVVSLYDTNGAAVTLFDNELGANGSTAKQTDSEGVVVVYVNPGEYDEEINGGLRRRVNVADNSLRTQLADSESAVLVGGVEAGVVAKRSGSAVYVTEYGAVGDGVTLDTVSINNALNAVAAAGEGELVFPKGNFLVSGSIFATLTGNPKIKIRGEEGAKITAASGFSAGKLLLILSSGVTGGSVTIEGLEFNAANVPNSGVGEANDAVYVSGAFDNVVVDNCNIYAGTVFSTSGSDSGVFIAEADKMTVSNCQIKGFPDAGIYISGDATGTIGENFTATNNEIEECSVAIISKRVHKKSLVSGNFIKKCPTGIAGGEAGASAGVKLVVTGNTLERCSVGINPRIDDGAVVTGNLIFESGYDSTATSMKAITIQGSLNCVVTGNAINGINPDIAVKNTNMIGILLERRVFDSVNYDPDNNLVGMNNIRGMGTGIKAESICTNSRILLNSIESTTVPYNLTGDYIKQEGNGLSIGGIIDGNGFELSYNSTNDILNMNNFADVRIDNKTVPRSSRILGGAGSAGAGNQYIEMEVNGVTYKILHDGTV